MLTHFAKLEWILNIHSKGKWNKLYKIDVIIYWNDILQVYGDVKFYYT